MENSRKELRVEARLRNNVLYQEIFSRYKSVSAFCKKNGFSQGLVGALLNLKHSPLNRREEFRPICIQLANFFKILPEDLFPLRIYDIPTAKGAIEISFAELPGRSELLQLPAPDSPFKKILIMELREKLDKWLATIDSRTEAMIRMYYEENCTHKEIGKNFGISSSRVAQIINRGLHMLRHRSRAKLLGDFVEIEKTGLSPPGFLTK